MSRFANLSPAHADDRNGLRAPRCIGDTELMADDGMGERRAEFKGMALAIAVGDDAEGQRVFAALAEGGTITMPLMKAFWTSSFGILTDKFGVPWMVNVAMPRA